jgi:hypothetical protein
MNIYLSTNLSQAKWSYQTQMKWGERKKRFIYQNDAFSSRSAIYRMTLTFLRSGRIIEHVCHFFSNGGQGVGNDQGRD